MIIRLVAKLDHGRSRVYPSCEADVAVLSRGRDLQSPDPIVNE
jgi:hypothetical protein